MFEGGYAVQQINLTHHKEVCFSSQTMRSATGRVGTGERVKEKKFLTARWGVETIVVWNFL
ncbi:MAG: hypothetical protein KatS3mg100_350 [Candidatus Parcubacteria bacterium]|nr:MAG: hypothetical protein KatS3mg100_350 [Candidatus Parcubacteria bacterium]